MTIFCGGDASLLVKYYTLPPRRVVQSFDPKELGIVKICRKCNLVFENIFDSEGKVFCLASQNPPYVTIINNRDRVMLSRDGVYRITMENGRICAQKIRYHDCSEPHKYEGCFVREIEICDKCRKVYMARVPSSFHEHSRLERANNRFYFQLMDLDPIPLQGGRHLLHMMNGHIRVVHLPKQCCT